MQLPDLRYKQGDDPAFIEYPLNEVGLLYSCEHDSLFVPSVTVAEPAKVLEYAKTPMPKGHSDEFIDLMYDPDNPENPIINEGHHRLSAAVLRGETVIPARLHYPYIDADGVYIWPTEGLY